MPTEATFLLAALLIVWAASGWAFGRFGDKDRNAPPTRISADYIRGLNLVLSRRTDEALELFLQMAKVDDDTLETHFALGHLFRRRGEVDRAIRVHQNLLARPSLSEEQRHQALYALGEDYLGAGLFDRAEKLFNELCDSETVAKAALERLVYIYEREQEWKKAIETHRRLEVLSGEKSSQVAHYYCELAEQAIRDGDLQLARDHLKSTVRSETGALRGALIRAEIAKREGDYAQALGLYEQVLDRDRAFIAEVLPNLFACFQATGQVAAFERYVAELIEQDESAANDLAYAGIAGDLTESPALVKCVENFVLHDEILSNLVDVEDLQAEDLERRTAAFRRIAGALRKLTLSNARYRCANCGYSTQRFLWHCPSCKLWESIRPIQRVPLESLMS
ncbi:MAG TPA: lipopolysaccharide assembly protein LapB [Gammaproteobacteria bacterium]